MTNYTPKGVVVVVVVTVVIVITVPTDGIPHSCCKESMLLALWQLQFDFMM
ncbi:MULTISPECIES: hypothetical protein [Culturomica]|jgi:hypothetical protein|uniref:hypothetical protein n=1 Tax=Culturomica TaxID=1926651 RepID=UPI0003396B97|nr:MULTISPECIES: hypothetical protein [Odoribacteraceae]CCZ07632.1 unknown [Odoribacter sp. CAG:788]